MDQNSGHSTLVVIEAGEWDKTNEGLVPFCEKIVKFVFSDLKPLGYERAEVGICLTDDAQIQSLNKEYRGQDKATNVLSFPVMKIGEAPPDQGAVLFGDIVLAFTTVSLEARLEKKDLRAHMAHLLVHGSLHLLGYDHENDADAVVMEGHEVRLLGGLGFPSPYPTVAV